MSSTISKIETEKAVKAAGPYSQAVLLNMKEASLLFVSGQLPINPATGKLVEGDVREATRQVLNNIEAILQASGSSFQHVVRTDVFLKDLNDFSIMNEEYQQRFIGPNYPARQTIEVSKLPLGSLVEISCIAVTS